MSENTPTEDPSPETSISSQPCYNMKYLTGPLFTIHIPLEHYKLHPPHESTHLTFTIHKQLLQQISAELNAHLSNFMREGLTNSMTLHDVKPETFALFARWAYSEDYQVDPEDVNALVMHTRLLVFAERFNVERLRGLCVGRIEEVLERWRAKHGEDEGWNIWTVCEVLRMIFDNLPLEFNLPEVVEVNSEKNKTKNGKVENDKMETPLQILCRVILSFCGRNHKMLRTSLLYRELLSEYPEFSLGIMDMLESMNDELIKGDPPSQAIERKLRTLEWFCGKCGREAKAGLDPRSAYFCRHGCGVQVLTLAVRKR